MRRIVLLIGLLLAACTHDPASQKLEVINRHKLPEPKIEFLGVGGWLLHWKGEGLLLPPFFSHPAGFGIEGIPPLTVVADTTRIDKYMDSPQPDVTMVLVGHAHYDHLLDLAHLRQRFLPNPKLRIYGSETVAHLLRSSLVYPSDIVVPGRAQISDRNNPAYRGTWFYSSHEQLRDGDDPRSLPKGPPRGRIRAMPLESMHAPHKFGVNFLQGAYDHDPWPLPTATVNWRLGHKTLAWVIDLLDDDGQPAYRIHYQDSASDPPWGFPPVIADSKGFDVAIICAASSDKVGYYPTGLLRVIKPRLVLVGHWENFFGGELQEPEGRKPEFKARTIPLQKYDQLVDDLKKSGYPYHTLEPLSEIALPAPR
ncbi:MBL fold metallo-hydrolase [Pseudomonas citronellolis]|uniref:MBL fold metallo-hydrolase n=1 Tax=Pseudomonas citronellolis TaxID=53408 RepID=UPI0023E43AD2|nr:MBL fold metallo-hydrolase [Pseudomonas citronellolis]MDF3933534.1 MBL fold metallo-hydrolase [Pseudomonas citronellolis]